MKDEIQIQESIDKKKKMIDSRKNAEGGPLTDGILHDLKIQADVLEWVLKG